MFEEARKSLIPMNLQLFAEEADGETETDEETADAASGKPEDKAGANADEKKQFSQAQLNRMMAKEKQQGRAAALKEMGIDPKDTAAVERVKAALESMKTEDQKKADADAEKDRRLAEAERRAMEANVKVLAMQEGISPKYVDDAIVIVLSKAADDADTSALKTLIGELKSKNPSWAESSDEEKQGKKGTGASIKSLGKGKPGDKKEDEGLGARLAAQRKPAVKSSYWGSKK